VCASSSLIPAVNKLGTVPLLLAASEDLRKRYLPAVASGEANVLLRPLRARGRQ
jgi:acyl-CoA dehydrogenase